MPISNHYRRVPCKDIKVLREERQRRYVQTINLEESVRRFGVMQPILIERDLTLIAGERRLATSIKLGIPDIPCRFADELEEHEKQILELDENIRRAELDWQDSIRAHGKIHDLYLSRDPKWPASKTAIELGYDNSTIGKILRVYKDINQPKISSMPTFSAAYNYLLRLDERGTDAAIAMIMEAGQEHEDGPVDEFTASLMVLFPEGKLEAEITPADLGLSSTPLSPPKTLKPVDSILCADFTVWSQTYSGPKFNFIHFDPPYGIEVFAGKQSGYETLETTYNDSETTFWSLLGTLCLHRNRLMQTGCHIMFWFSMDFYSQIISFMAEEAPEFSINPFPLIWHKSDGSSILPDPRRGGRRSYETAFLMSRGDRFVVKPVANLYSAPTNKALHPSTKPEPMLRHFFQLFVDEHTIMLDPTCGSGSSIRAAESMGCKQALGLERDPIFAERAQEALRMERLKAQAAKGA